MPPRYRRALIPGLLVALLVVVVIAAVAKQARADDGTPAPHRVSTITDARIEESSALVVSTRDPALAYTINDSGNAPRVFVVAIATGDVVGVTTLTGFTLVDTEALALDRDGQLMVADIGDNDGVRSSVALYALDQPGRGNHDVRPTRYRLAYSDGPQDAETLLSDPRTAAMYVVSKGLLGGEVHPVPSDLSTTRTTTLSTVPHVRVPVLVTDGDVTPDGSRVVLRNYLTAFAYDAATWKLTWSGALPRERQGESLAVEPGGRSFLVNTEGLPSPILRVTLPAGPPTAHLQPAGGIIDAG